MTIDDTLLSILVCPADRGSLLYVEDSLYNPRLRRRYRIDDGIPVLLVDEAVAVEDAEHRRLVAASRSAQSAENPGSSPVR
ncbi:MAG: Trm112 family protein [Mycolicibacterium sp.]|uniref:Trm112 family protein n=1 Tax=Mycolicibacterium sp. TaxID=2320850 RepID=UPI003D0BE074